METMEEFLDSENELLDKILENQAGLRKVVNSRDWEKLVKITAELDDMADRFSKIETARSALPNQKLELKSREKLTQIRSKLVKSQAENKALGEYVSVMHGFVRGVIEEAIPQRRNKLYGRNGAFVDAKPSSILVNALF